MGVRLSPLVGCACPHRAVHGLSTSSPPQRYQQVARPELPVLRVHREARHARPTPSAAWVPQAALPLLLVDLLRLVDVQQEVLWHGEAGGGTWTDLEPLPATTAYLAGAWVQRVQGSAGGGGHAGGT